MLSQVLDAGSYSFSLFSIPTAVAAGSILLLGLLVLARERVSPVSNAFLLVTLTVTIWLFCTSWVYAAHNEAVALWWAKAAYLGVPFIAPATYQFTVIFLGIYRHYRNVVRLAWLGSILFALAALGTDALVHHVMLYPWGYYGSYGWLGLPFIAFFSGLLTASMAHYMAHYRGELVNKRRQRIRWLMLAFGIGSTGIVDFVATYGIPLYPFGYLSILGFVLLSARAIWAYHLVAITPEFAANEIINTMGDALLVLDESGRISVANDAACDLFELERSRFVGKDVSEAIPEGGFGEWLQSIAWQPDVHDHEMSFLRKGGEQHILSISTTVALDADGDPAAAVCVVRDITSYKRAEEQIRQQNAYLAALHETSLGLMHRLDLIDLLEAIINRAAALVNSTHGYIYVVDLRSEVLSMQAGTGLFASKIGSRLKKGEGLAGQVWATGQPLRVDNYQDWSSRSSSFADIEFRAVVGVPLGSEISGVLGLAHVEPGRTFDDNAVEILTKFAQLASIALDNAELYGAARQELIERERAEAEVRNLNENLETIVAERTAALANANRELQNEIAERQRAEAERAQLLISEQIARNRAEEGVRAREVLLSIVSHDLRNPLSAIRGTTRLLQNIISRNTKQLDSNVSSGLERVENSAKKMNLLIEELLDFARLQAGQPLDLYCQDIDLVDLVQVVAANHEHYTERHTIEVIADVPTLKGTWDPLRLERVLDNLVANAIKYSPTGGRITISISREDGATEGAGQEGDYNRDGRVGMSVAGAAVIVIRDEGIGIPPSDLPHVFDWFHRASNVSGRFSGTGIGLATVRQAIEQHGGTVTVQSLEGSGTQFTVRLPLSPPIALTAGVSVRN